MVVVEHDEETIKCADFIIDIGPGAGTNGGTVVATGSPDSIAKNKSSLTGLYLSKKKKINVANGIPHRTFPKHVFLIFWNIQIAMWAPISLPEPSLIQVTAGPKTSGENGDQQALLIRCQSPLFTDFIPQKCGSGHQVDDL